MARNGITWNGASDKRLGRVFTRFPDACDKYLTSVVRYEATYRRGQMKQLASWTDRTGNARNGLNAQATVGGGTYAVTLFGSVPYQIWLEVRFSGRYAIIGPQSTLAQANVMKKVSRMLASVGVGLRR